MSSSPAPDAAPGKRRPGPPRKLIAVADLHGELAAFRRILTHAGLVEGDSWRGGTSILVQLGDVIDRGRFSVATYNALNDLQIRARKGRGRVVRLLGNHELMLLEGDYSLADFSEPKKLAEEIREDVVEGKVQAAFSYGGWFFTHAGVAAGLLTKLRGEMRAQSERPRRFSLKRLAEHINNKLKDAARTGDYIDAIFTVGAPRGGDKGDTGGIFWADFDEELHTPRRVPKVHQVFGHTPEGYTGARFRKTSDGRRLNIDLGISEEYGGNLGYLAIQGRQATAVYLNDEGAETEPMGEAPAQEKRAAAGIS